VDNNERVSEMQREWGERRPFYNLGLRLFSPINMATLGEKGMQDLWEKVRTQDYVFDDFTRDNALFFAASLAEVGVLHFELGEGQGYAVVRNLAASDNADLHYCVWDPNMPFKRILQAGEELVNFLFTQAKVHRITATCPTYNPNAARFATLLGFKFEGLMRQAIRYHDAHHDVKIYGIIRKEWEEARYNPNAIRYKEHADYAGTSAAGR